MCGIAGINASDKLSVERAVEELRHRGPDAQTIWVDENISFGHTRLSVIDLNERSNQPMWDVSGKYSIIFNGEIYNYRELKNDLESSYNFLTESDTEVLLVGYITEGPDFFRKLKGMYAFAIYDLVLKKLVIAKDHAGIKPLYYLYENGVFAFASETRALQSMFSKVQFQIDREAVSMYWVLGYVPSPKTLYKQIHVVPKSSYIQFDLVEKKIEITPFLPDVVGVNNKKDLFNLIESKIISHLVADVPVGLFFSGGTDSSLIAAILHKHKINLEAFTLRVKGRSSDEHYAAAISEYLQLKSHAFDFSDREFDEIYDDALMSLDVPIADNSIFPTSYISKKARERAVVVLSGEGGDELFFGYARQRNLLRMGKIRTGDTTWLDRLFLNCPSFIGKNRLFAYLFTVCKDPLSYYMLSMSPSRDLISKDSWKITKLFLKSVSNALYLDRDMYLENDLLRKLDTATMHFALESRVPLLDPDLIASAPNFLDSYLNSQDEKPVLKEMLLEYLPQHIVQRDKSGFGINPALFILGSKKFLADYKKAVPYLVERKLCDVSLRVDVSFISRYLNLALAAVILYKILSRDPYQG